MWAEEPRRLVVRAISTEHTWAGNHSRLRAGGGSSMRRWAPNALTVSQRLNVYATSTCRFDQLSGYARVGLRLAIK